MRKRGVFGESFIFPFYPFGGAVVFRYGVLRTPYSFSHLPRAIEQSVMEQFALRSHQDRMALVDAVT
jgi:hypothetical protein